MALRSCRYFPTFSGHTVRVLKENGRREPGTFRTAGPDALPLSKPGPAHFPMRRNLAGADLLTR